MYADPTSLEPGALPAWLDEPLGLRPEVTRLSGANGQPMLYVPASKGYVRLSQSGAVITSLLDGTATGAEVVAEIAARRPAGSSAPVDHLVAGFLEELRAADALTVPSAPTPRRSRLARVLGIGSHLPLLKSVGPVVRLPAAVLRRFPRAVMAAFVLLGGLAAAATLTVLTARATHSVLVVWWFLPIAIVVEVTLHELGHATVCEALGTPAREAGVALLCWILPIAYVDCTDAYRLPQRSRRVAIAMAGPAVDVLAAGITAAVALNTSGSVAATAHLLLAIQVILVVGNLNPLLPTDGYHALEAGLGGLNYRRRAFAYAGHRLFGRPLPAALGSPPRSRRITYLTYAILAALYLVVIVAMVVIMALFLITAVSR
jgi:putative peptide zinc metalloprotease protein